MAGGGIRWQTSEPIKIAERRLIEDKVTILHTMAQSKGLSSTGEVTKTGGKGLKIDNSIKIGKTP